MEEYRLIYSSAIADEEKKEQEKKIIEDNFENYRTRIVTKMAFLIGTRNELLDSEEYKFDKDIIAELRKNEKAMIIRYLCILRTQFMLNCQQIEKRRTDLIPLDNMDDLFSKEAVEYLRSKNIEVAYINNSPANPTTNCAYINQYLGDHIDQIRNLFPEWVKFEYIRKLFLMPKGAIGANGKKLSKQGLESGLFNNIKAARANYLKNKNHYPYGMFLMWPGEFKETDGNVLFNDSKFLKLLYLMNGDIFKATEYVIDAKQKDKKSIYDFVGSAKIISIFVDCENVDPYMFVSTILNLDQKSLNKIKNIYLIDDIHTSPAWDYLESVCSIPLIHQETERIIESKSLVDHVMSSMIAKAVYKEDTDSVIIASSDSDFWGVISTLSEAKFYVLNEKRITSETTIENLDAHAINHCFMDDFAMESAHDFKQKILIQTLKKKVDTFNETGKWEGSFDVKEFVDELFMTAQIKGAWEQIEMEKKTFTQKYLKKGFIFSPVEEDGVMTFKMELNKK